MSNLENLNWDSISNFNGQTAIVTGASSGIGLSIAKKLSSNGANVVLGDLSPPPEEIPNSVFQTTDVSKWDSLLSLFQKAIQTHGSIDVVCVNAGILEADRPFDDTVDSNGLPVEPRYLTIQVNLLGAMSTTKLAIHFMKKQKKGGSIVLTASMAGYGARGIPTYSASKHGLVGMMRGLRDFLPPHNITINAVAPGWTDTAIYNNPGDFEKIKQTNMRTQGPDAVALAILYLAQNKDMNGQTLSVLGGKYVELEGVAASAIQNATAPAPNESEDAKPATADANKVMLELIDMKC